jgi:TRAP-type C4-dicarboxylate transport system permease small subunit
VKSGTKYIHALLNLLIGVALALMAILVFGNVVLRYVFNSGITWSEEMSRYLFIWLIFLGSIPALMANEHLGVDMLVKRLPTLGKKIVFVISNLLILITLWLVTQGGWKLATINFGTISPATGIPMQYVSGVLVVMGISMAVIVLFKLYRVLFTKMNEDDLILTTDSEDLIEIESADEHKDQRGVPL